MDALRTGFIGGCGDDPPVLRVTTDDDGLTTQGWIISLFDGSIERVHVYVQNLAASLKRYRRGRWFGWHRGQLWQGSSFTDEREVDDRGV